MRYDRLPDDDKEKFGLYVRKLLNQSFIISSSDSEAYNYIRNYEEAIDEYLGVLGYTISINSEQMVIGLEEADITEQMKYNFREKLRKTHTALLACIWKLYIQKINEFADPDELWFEMKELKEIMQTWNLTKKDLTATEMEEAFRLFSKHNLVRVLSGDLKNPNTRVQMLPSLCLCMQSSEFEYVAAEFSKEYGIEGEKEKHDE